MNIVFMGSQEWGSIFLKFMISNGYIPNLVFGSYTRVKKNENILNQICLDNGISYYKSSDINSYEIYRLLSKIKIDLIITAGFDHILSNKILRTTKIAINIHDSILPNYKGPLPSFWVIRNNEKKTGVTIHLINDKIDSGSILAQVEYIINKSDTYGSLFRDC